MVDLLILQCLCQSWLGCHGTTRPTGWYCHFHCFLFSQICHVCFMQGYRHSKKRLCGRYIYFNLKTWTIQDKTLLWIYVFRRTSLISADLLFAYKTLSKRIWAQSISWRNLIIWMSGKLITTFVRCFLLTVRAQVLSRFALWADWSGLTGIVIGFLSVAPSLLQIEHRNILSQRRKRGP